MRLPNLRPALLIPLVAWSLSGCAWIFHRHTAVKVRPVAEAALQPGALADDGLYLDAQSAINARDYATALDALQAAKTRAPNDVRVLNAFGVVYDKLGRFDLSERYYTWAAKLDPQSPIIANNLKYSRFLQDQQLAERAMTSGSALARNGAVADPYEALYHNALTAISSGRNAQALDLLAQARDQKPGDARVLRALGTVYANMGRPDLRDRYYAKADSLNEGPAYAAGAATSTMTLAVAAPTAHTAKSPQ